MRISGSWPAPVPVAVTAELRLQKMYTLLRLQWRTHVRWESSQMVTRRTLCTLRSHLHQQLLDFLWRQLIKQCGRAMSLGGWLRSVPKLMLPPGRHHRQAVA